MSLGADVGREELVDRVEQVRDVVVGRAHVLDVALVVVVGGADERLPEPRQHEDPAPAARRARSRPTFTGRRSRGEDDVRAAAGPDHRHLGLVVELVGPERSAHTPVALTTSAAAIVELARPSRRRAPRRRAARPPSSTSPVTSSRLANTAPKRSASPSTVRTSRTSSVWQS